MKQLDTKLMHPADQITVVIGRIYRSGMTTTSGGNISIKDENGDIWITPGAVDKGSLTPKDIVCVKADGTVIGPHKPSSEFPFHKAIYEMRPKMTAVIHARTRIVQYHAPDSEHQHHSPGKTRLRNDRVRSLRRPGKSRTGQENRYRIQKSPRL